MLDLPRDEETYDADLVWCAAFAAQRINKEYVKVGESETKTANRDLASMIIWVKPWTINDEDRDLAKEARRYYKSFTFRLLEDSKMSDFDRLSLKVADLDRVGYREVGVICSLPVGYLRLREKMRVDEIIRNAKGGPLGQVGQVVDNVALEVLKFIPSKQYPTNFIMGLTDQDQVVFFSRKEMYTPGIKMTIRAKVREHKDNVTYLHYAAVKSFSQ